MKRSPIKPKRETPRRDEGRITHGRIKRKATGKSAEEARHIERVAAMRCCLCGNPEANVHHIMHIPDKRCRRDHRWIAPLCKRHHQGDVGVHGLGGEQAFLERHQFDLVRHARLLWETSQRGS
jgi:hypothetical protein